MLFPVEDAGEGKVAGWVDRGGEDGWHDESCGVDGGMGGDLREDVRYLGESILWGCEMGMEGEWECRK